jgi:hypothetical protein
MPTFSRLAQTLRSVKVRLISWNRTPKGVGQPSTALRHNASLHTVSKGLDPLSRFFGTDVANRCISLLSTDLKYSGYRL